MGKIDFKTLTQASTTACALPVMMSSREFERLRSQNLSSRDLLAQLTDYTNQKLTGDN
jgi:hypothetical protein